MEEARLEQIESKLAHLELALQELDETVLAQGGEIGRLTQICNELAQRLRSLGEGGGDSPAGEERPPHY